MSILDYLRPATQTRKNFSPSSGELLDAESQAFDLTEMLKTIFNPEYSGIQTISQDQHTEIIDLKVSMELATLTILVGVAIDDTFIDVETETAPTIAMTICLKEGTAFYQGRPLSVEIIGTNQYRLEMDTPFDYAFTISGGCSLNTTNLAVDGSVTPKIFKVSPKGLTAGTKWDITRFILLWGGTGVTAQDPSPDDSDFGVMPALTKGIVLRSVNGVTKNIFNAKTNGDLRTRAYDLSYQPASKTGIYTVTTRRSFNGSDKNGVTVRRETDTDDECQIIIQDDLTHMTGGQLVLQGHVVD